jgi:hypothetical protein
MNWCRGLSRKLPLKERLIVVKRYFPDLKSVGISVAAVMREDDGKFPAAWVQGSDYDALAAMLKQQDGELNQAADELAEFRSKLAESCGHRMVAENRIRALEAEVETERMRLAGCGVAALGYFNGCAPEYDSASLQDVLKLRKRVDSEFALRKTAETYAARNALRVIELDAALERYALNPPWDRVIALEAALREMLDWFKPAEDDHGETWRVWSRNLNVLHPPVPQTETNCTCPATMPDPFCPQHSTSRNRL